MPTNTRRPFVALLLGLALVPWLLVPIMTGAGAPSPLWLDAAPGGRVYLPLVVRQPPASGDAAMERAVADEINQQRSAHGLPPVRPMVELGDAARGHSRDMAENGLTGHIGSDGSTVGERLVEVGYDWTAWGEIVACGAIADAGQVVDLWMGSPDHRAVILSSSYADFGVGYVSDPASQLGRYWTVDFGRQASP
jgi:uncharacterized protein YkwD